MAFRPSTRKFLVPMTWRPWMRFPVAEGPIADVICWNSIFRLFSIQRSKTREMSYSKTIQHFNANSKNAIPDMNQWRFWKNAICNPIRQISPPMGSYTLNIIILIPEYWGQLYDSDWIVLPQKYYNDTRNECHLNERSITRPSTNCGKSWEVWNTGYETNLVSLKIAVIPNIWHTLPNFEGLFCGINLLVVSRQISLD